MMFDLFDFFLLHRTAKFVRCSQVVIIFLWWYHTYVVHAHYSLVFEWVWQHAVQRRVVPVARRVQDAGTCAPVLTALSVFALDRGPKRTWQVVLILLYCFLLYFALLLLYLLQNLNLLVSRFVFGDWAPSFAIDSIESVDIAQVYHKVLVATTIILIQEFLWLRPKRGKHFLICHIHDIESSLFLAGQTKLLLGILEWWSLVPLLLGATKLL